MDQPAKPGRAFAAWVLAEISPEATLVEFTETPEGRYALRIEIPGEVAKSFSLPKRAIDDAVAIPHAFRALRALLHAEVLGVRHTRAVRDARGALAASRVRRGRKPPTRAAPPSDESIRDFLGKLIGQIEPQARLIGFADTADGYVIQVGLEGRLGKAFALPKALVDKAPVDPASAAATGNILRVETSSLRSQKARRNRGQTLD